ncbi:unnamed protein product [Arabidopsis thaliana]|uniref:Uncharacterized protein n=2 Tax=Arabidopsis thaliana TaxID=3702 RepID=A0A654G4H2_ARATH|nr:uncharacterized protein AT5G27340 [Arabidopsis thaliana]AED93674.1 hypothetical protein AT5G27340 [Arabidopsis thaliana]CAA0405100.1 unnamed protein product [Arabidopsis thaliana]VYS68068.1 unnamed protein product [Arabidopsis thaliana]|eukprot:NP_198086.1 hypothetical protein AT5G27340 [Arabidopsis thaliana]
MKSRRQELKLPLARKRCVGFTTMETLGREKLPKAEDGELELGGMGKRSLHKGRRLEHRILKEHVRQVWEIGRSFRERSMELLLGIKQPYQRQLSTKEIISSSLELRYKYEEFDDLLLTKVREIVSRSHCKDIDIELDWCPRSNNFTYRSIKFIGLSNMFERSDLGQADFGVGSQFSEMGQEIQCCEPKIMSCAADNTTRRGARDGPRAVAPAINEVWCVECSRSSWACLDPALPSSLW